uniref:Isocitrate lyase n=1 Tax=Leersia perrieri TaxID=77586 RepID=A0A0D9W438_9ORYZ
MPSHPPPTTQAAHAHHTLHSSSPPSPVGLLRAASSAPARRVRNPPLPLRRAGMAARSPYFVPESEGIRSGESPAAALRRILASPGAHQAPCCFDALGARLVQRAGFPICFMGGFCVSAARLGLPDAGLISYGEMVDQGRLITEAVSVPVIGDGDNGYGNAMNIKRTVKGYINAGFAGIMLEDQVAPKACGHTEGRKVISREDAIMHIKAAIDARKESGSDIVIIARTDSRQAISIDEALWRVQAFADAGADVLFIDALASIEEMKAFCAVSPKVSKMANMLEGGGKTPILSPTELAEIGFNLVVYPLSLIGVSMRAMEDALIAIKSSGAPPPGSLPSFQEIKDTLGFNRYYKEEKQYAIQSSSPNGIILRLKITEKSGAQKINEGIPAGILEKISKAIPGLAGVNFAEILQGSDQSQKGKMLLDCEDATGDRIQVSIE